jgi:putative RNA 2'-phosphotransferase
MNEKSTIKASKFLSLVLRHEPERVGIILDEAGWVEVEVLLTAIAKHGLALSAADLQHIVATSEKKRFAISEDGKRIRANQGHSVEVDLGYSSEAPPELLYHGTTARFLEVIRTEGLQKMQRHDVHLSAEIGTATLVGGRHGKPVVLTIRSGEMHRAGNAFRCSANGVWLVDSVPPQFIEFPS